jgi:transcriptional regulator with XRE-family HTH domain
MNRFERLRFERGLTLGQVADGSGVSMSTVIRLERNGQKPGAATAKALADFYDIPVAELLGLEDRSAA